MSVPVYRGRFGPAQAERLLWRAGFGPAPGQAHKLARKGLRAAVRSLTRPQGKARLHGPTPHDSDGLPLAPTDAWGHDLLWWLDRMVRSNQPLVERMALVWHDWFATASVVGPKLMLKQNELFRRRGLGSFEKLLLAVTIDPAMLVWLSGNENEREAPNENYGRELMELFTLGAGNGYSENDVREQARALTGWTNDWDDVRGMVNFRFERDRHDYGRKRIFGKSGNFDWRDSCRLCIEHPAHARFFVERLWSYFVPTPPPERTLRKLIKDYRRDRSIRRVVEATLMHPALYEGPRMVKPPIVQIAGMLRARRAGIDTDSWIWIAEEAGQRLFEPPNVAGWDEQRWLDTARISGRWYAVAHNSRRAEIDVDAYDPTETTGEAVRKALRFWGNPTLSKRTRSELQRFSRQVEGAAREEWQQGPYRGGRQGALRTLIAMSPEFLTS